MMTQYKYEFATEPFAHQKEALAQSWNKDNYALLMDMGCVDATTEFLSPEGWIRMDQWKEGMKVAQYEPRTGIANFVDPDHYVKKPCKEMIRFKPARGTDQLLSPEHRMLFLKYGKDPMVLPAEEVEHRMLNGVSKMAHHKIPVAYHINNDTDLDLSDDEIRLQVAVMADGHFPKNCRTERVTIRLKKLRKVVRLHHLLYKCGVKAYIRDEPSTGFTIFSFTAPLKEKTYGKSWWKANYFQRQIIAEECLHWDGSKNGFYTKSKESADFIQHCFASTGKRTRLYHYEKRDEYSVILTLKRRPAVSLGYKKDTVSREPSPDGFKYCFMVPTSYLVFRRNGYVFVSGNTGKSKVLIDTVAINYEKGRIDSFLLIAPKGVYRNWDNKELPKHLHSRIANRLAVWRTSPTKKMQKDLDSVLQIQFDGALRILLMNIDAINTKKGYAVAEQFLKSGKCLMAIDESTVVKNHKAQRTKKILTLGVLANMRRILTGSPVTKNPMDLYTQFLFLSPSILQHRSYYTFKAEFAVERPMNIPGRRVKKIIGFKNLERLTNRLKGHSYRILKEDCLDLPPKQYDYIDVELTDAQRAIYNRLKNEAMVELETKTMTVNNVLTMILRLQQVLSGHIKWDDQEETEYIASNRLTACMDCLAEFSGKAVIWSKFRADIQLVASALAEEYGEESVVTYYGDTGDEERIRNLERFENDPKCRFMVSNPSTGGFGVEMTAATMMIYYSNSHNLEHRLQSEDRAHRSGQTKSVMYKDLRALKTVDEKIIECLRSKKNLAELVLGDNVKEWL